MLCRISLNLVVMIDFVFDIVNVWNTVTVDCMPQLEKPFLENLWS